MGRRTPLNISRKGHLRLILLLGLLLLAVVWLTRRPVASCALAPAPRAEAVSSEGTGRSASVATEGLELPACRDRGFLVGNREGRYTLCYDTACRQAGWVAYVLTRRDVRTKGAKRRNAFRCDPEVLARGWPSATDRDYAGSGFDRGHLLPSADRDGTARENGATFYLSNVSPQRPGLNRRMWRLLEEQVRRWADRYDSLYIVTGGELRGSLPSIGAGVAVPERYYKALLTRSAGGWHAVGFLIPNADDPPGRFPDYAMSVDELEAELDMDFFPALPHEIERVTEARFEPEFWK